MNKKSDSIVRFAAAVILVFFGIAALSYFIKNAKCNKALQLTEPPQEYDSIQFILYGIGDDTISARFSLLDTNGNEIVEIERSWNQSSLFVEFLYACYNGKYYSFPLRIYSGTNPASSSGVKLAPYYLTKKQCLLLGKKSKRFF